MRLGKARRVVGAEGHRGVVAVEQSVVDACDDRVERSLRESRLRRIHLRTVGEVVLLQGLVGEVGRERGVVVDLAVLARVAHERVNIVYVAEDMAPAQCVFLLPHLVALVANAAKSLIGKAKRSVLGREIVLRDLLLVEPYAHLGSKVAKGVLRPHVGQQIIVYALRHRVFQVAHGV